MDIIDIVCELYAVMLSETIEATQTSAESASEAAAERAAAGSQRAPEWTVSERGGVVPESDGGG